MDGHHTYIVRKIVRNASLERMASKGAKVEWRHLDAEEKRKELLLKLQEEAKEALHAKPDELADELADILELVNAVAALDGITQEQIEDARQAKVELRGDYSEGYYVDVIHCPVGSHWDEYCAQHPLNYPRLDNKGE